jgi:antitoxin (DNA-binding transcriptional repressor) of toxin-antitoxin stability system
VITTALKQVATGSYINLMKAVGIKVLKNKLSEYVRLAERGETVLVTDRDRVVAELVPPESTRSPVLADALLSEAVRKGWITPPTLAASGAPPRNPVTSFRKLQKEIEQDRSDR